MRSATLSTVLLLSLFTACSDSQANVDPMQVPVGLPENDELDLAPDNQLTAAKAELGKKLFFDTRLSKSGQMACVSCHHTDKAFTDGIAHSVKDGGGKNTRNSPTMYNVGYYPELYWDGRTVGLEQNVPAAWKGQLGGVPEEVAKTLNGTEAYKQEFQAAFQAEASETTIVHALSSFLRLPPPTAAGCWCVLLMVVLMVAMCGVVIQWCVRPPRADGVRARPWGG